MSLSLTPLKINEITSIDVDTEQVFCKASAILFESGIYTKLPKDLGDQLSLALMDVAGAPAQVAVHVKAGDTVVVVGAGKAGLLCLAEAKKRVAPTGKVICMEYSPGSVRLCVAWALRTLCWKPMQEASGGPGYLPECIG